MIKGFERETARLNPYEMALVPDVMKCLRSARGKEQAIRNEQIRNIIGNKLDDPRMRKIINYIRINGLVPGLMANSRGYFVASSQEELDQYLESLQGRISAIQALIDKTKENRHLLQTSHY